MRTQARREARGQQAACRPGQLSRLGQKGSFPTWVSFLDRDLAGLGCWAAGWNTGTGTSCKTRALDCKAKQPVHCVLCFPGRGGIARGNWANEGSLRCTEYSGFVCGLNDVPRALWGHPGEKGRCRIMCFLFSIMQLHVAVLDLLRSCVYVTQRDVLKPLEFCLQSELTPLMLLFVEGIRTGNSSRQKWWSQ